MNSLGPIMYMLKITFFMLLKSYLLCMISVVKHCCTQSDPTQMYPGKNKVKPGWNIGGKRKLSTV